MGRSVADGGIKGWIRTDVNEVGRCGYDVPSTSHTPQSLNRRYAGARIGASAVADITKYVDNLPIQ